MIAPRLPVAIFFALLLTTLAGFAAEPIWVLPSATDRRVQNFNEPHLALLPEGSPRGKLLLFLPGTGGTPEKGLFGAFTTTAARLGYHVVVLMYPDQIAAQKHCGASSDPDCHLKFRKAIIQGGSISPRHWIGPADSIENRFEKLLLYLDAIHHDEGWGRFLDSQGKVRWRDVAVSGQSQGGGHSYVLGKLHEVERVIMFGSPKDYSFRSDRPAQGFDGVTKTPLRRFFAYNHVRDNGNGCTHDEQARILKQIGLIALGVADADQIPPPFNHARVLYTNADLGDSKGFHGSVLKRTLKGNPAVWTYLLTEEVE